MSHLFLDAVGTAGKNHEGRRAHRRGGEVSQYSPRLVILNPELETQAQHVAHGLGAEQTTRWAADDVRERVHESRLDHLVIAGPYRVVLDEDHVPDDLGVGVGVGGQKG